MSKINQNWVLGLVFPAGYLIVPPHTWVDIPVALVLYLIWVGVMFGMDGIYEWLLQRRKSSQEKAN